MEGQLATLAEFFRQLKNNIAQKLDATISSRAAQASLDNVKDDTWYCRNRSDQIKSNTTLIPGLVNDVEYVKNKISGTVPTAGGGGLVPVNGSVIINGSGLIRCISVISGGSGSIKLIVDGITLYNNIYVKSGFVITNLRFKSYFRVSNYSTELNYAYTLGD